MFIPKRECWVTHWVHTHQHTFDAGVVWHIEWRYHSINNIIKRGCCVTWVTCIYKRGCCLIHWVTHTPRTQVRRMQAGMNVSVFLKHIIVSVSGWCLHRGVHVHMSVYWWVFLCVWMCGVYDPSLLPHAQLWLAVFVCPPFVDLACMISEWYDQILTHGLLINTPTPANTLQATTWHATQYNTYWRVDGLHVSFNFNWHIITIQCYFCIMHYMTLLLHSSQKFKKRLC
jgi:hypothetical protein